MEFKLYYKVFNAGRPRTETVDCSCLKGAIDYGMAKYGNRLVRMTYFDANAWMNVGHWINQNFKKPETRREHNER